MGRSLSRWLWVSGKTVILDASGALANTGTIAASENAALKAGTLLNGGSLSAGGNWSYPVRAIDTLSSVLLTSG
jgi:hypothetical protein